MKKYIFLGFALIGCLTSKAQLTMQPGATLTIQAGGTLVAEAAFTSNKDILGAGTVVMKGPSLQQLNMNGFSVSNLEIDNNNNVALQNGAVRIGSSLVFTNGKLLTGSGDIVISNTASINGAGASKYIVTNGTGRLVRVVDGVAKLFPIGADVSSYSPVTLTNAGTPDDFFVRVMPGVFANGTAGAQLTEKAVNRTWLIDEGTAGGSNANVNLGWNIAEELPLFNSSGVSLNHYISSHWDPGPPQAVAYSNNISSISRPGITSFSPFAVSSGIIAGPVPVTLLDFNASILNTTVVTKWTTASEMNSSHFDLERSADGIRFSLVGAVPAAGMSSIARQYTFTDMQPLPTINFYRLKMADLDGQYRYSRTVPVKFGDHSFQVFPNPVKDVLGLQADGHGISVLYITDAIGRKVKEEKVSLSGITSFSVDVSGLPPGVYTIVIDMPDKKLQQKFVKQ